MVILNVLNFTLYLGFLNIANFIHSHRLHSVILTVPNYVLKNSERTLSVSETWEEDRNNNIIKGRIY